MFVFIYCMSEANFTIRAAEMSGFIGTLQERFKIYKLSVSVNHPSTQILVYCHSKLITACA